MTLYKAHRPWEIEPHFTNHMEALINEPLPSKADIAMQLAYRDKTNDHLQSRIDALMLEYCPDEMTQGQLATWASHQVPATDAAERSIQKAIDSILISGKHHDWISINDQLPPLWSDSHKSILAMWVDGDVIDGIELLNNCGDYYFNLNSNNHNEFGPGKMNMFHYWMIVPER